MKKLAGLLSLLVMFLAACSNNGASYETIPLNDVVSQQVQGALVIDVREMDEYAAGHIPGAMNKPLSEISEGNYEGLDPEQDYVIVCQSGNRSKQASGILAEEGYRVTNVEQGMLSWTGAVEK
ncbi:sulfurtransferase [Chryseomicrobium excrementi]|uniref:Sulfurtransferase n=1 Tax=Chryseomicrobium excrementi TaxID=2041346 RepID=A0A2M9EZW0_9BACL|nr:rhodanese-like domain-containing protein [Chryseomicrobium excrementi]PJK16748.1 sulfurtransferase [Chryseomicrobium excrementi]